MKKLLVVLTVIAVAAALAVLLRPSPEHKPPPVEGLPWQIDLLPQGGSRVFGLTLGHSTLEDARARYGADMEVALIAAPGESGTLEAYYMQFTAGVLDGKLILVAGLDPQTLDGLRKRSPRSEFMNSTTRKFHLRRDDLALAYAAPIVGITFIPAASVDAPTAIARFGAPAERVPAGATAEHLLYPEKGLDLLLDTRGKEVLQYVAPREFARLRDPLVKRAAEMETR